MNAKYHSMAEHFITYFTFNASLTLFNFFNTFPFILNNFNVYLCSSPPSSIMAFAMNIYLGFGRCDVITMTTLKWIFGILGRSLYFWYLIVTLDELWIKFIKILPWMVLHPYGQFDYVRSPWHGNWKAFHKYYMELKTLDDALWRCESSV